MKSFTLKEIKFILSEYNIPFCPTELVNSKEGAIKIANSFNYPVVLKVFSLEGAHKTELGLVKKDIGNDNELSSAWDEIVKAKADGIIVQKQIFGLEIIVGMKRDVQFGPVLMFGIGGVLVEIMKDVTFRIAPVTKKDVLDMFKEIKGAKLLSGFRGQPPVDLEKLSVLVFSLSKLSLARKDIKEIDFNPVIADENGVWVVDPRFSLN